MSLSLEEGLELVSNRLLSILDRLEGFESNPNLSAQEAAFVDYTKDQAMLRIALLISLSENFDKHKKEFLSKEIKKLYKFCKEVEHKTMLLNTRLRNR